MQHVPVFLIAALLAACGPRPLPIGGAQSTPDVPALAHPRLSLFQGKPATDIDMP
jgi:hypothetical protein